MTPSTPSQFSSTHGGARSGRSTVVLPCTRRHSQPFVASPSTFTHSYVVPPTTSVRHGPISHWGIAGPALHTPVVCCSVGEKYFVQSLLQKPQFVGWSYLPVVALRQPSSVAALQLLSMPS